ncbi:hypothetical protein PCIT_a2413 [Pseudoalteromonas citrea]|uniref:Uncharacterized protein n=1 Tax=Pseudoalteromonas citrea TaxID=43655 RepID=A0AAD4AJQ1_9GAMM|nr:hypothetical protein PCIT_a2413 [Pseudoalteromonas citrea]
MIKIFIYNSLNKKKIEIEILKKIKRKLLTVFEVKNTKNLIFTK